MNKISLFSLSLLSLVLVAPVAYGMEGNKPRIPKSIEWLARLSGVGFAGFYTYLIYDLGHKTGEKEGHKAGCKEAIKEVEDLKEGHLYLISKKASSAEELRKAVKDTAFRIGCRSEFLTWVKAIGSKDKEFYKTVDRKFESCREQIYEKAVAQKAIEACIKENDKYDACKDKFKQAYGKLY